MATKVTSDSSCGSIRHSELWFDDGSIILIADTTEFRVHKSLLCAQSEVFADMFSVPQPPGEHAMRDCPIVHLPDAADGVAALLTAMYNPISFFAPYESCDVTALAALLPGARLCNKYCASVLLTKIADILKKHFPCGPAVPNLVTFLRTTRACTSALDFLFSVHAFVREINLSECLPSILYICARLDAAKLFRNTPPRLPLYDAATCAVARERMMPLQRTLTHSFVFDFRSTAPCKKRLGRCAPPSPTVWRWHANGDTARLLILAPFGDAWEKLGFCASCLEEARRQHVEGHKKVWAMLPQFFDLGSWEQLCQMDRQP